MKSAVNYKKTLTTSSFAPPTVAVRNKRVALLAAALRSSNYVQNTGALGRRVTRARKTEDKYCVMGVACMVAIKQGVPIKVTSSPISNELAFNGLHWNAPFEVTDYFGIKQHTRALNKLVSLNDQGVPFAKLANYITTTSALYKKII